MPIPYQLPLGLKKKKKKGYIYICFFLISGIAVASIDSLLALEQCKFHF